MTDGWASVQLTDDLTVHAKGGRDAAGRLIVTELLISAPEITTTVLRQINPHRVLLAGIASEDREG